MAVAALALFLALSGSVVAATKLSKNSVTTKEIKNKSVKGGDLADDTLTGEQIIETTLGVVPRAATAGTATAAGAATTAQTAKVAERAGSAATADRAGSAGTADRAATARDADRLAGRAASDFVSSQEVFSVSAKFAAGDSRTLLERDGARLVARCSSGVSTVSGGTADVLSIYVESNVDGATFSSPKESIDGSGGATLGPGTAESDRLAVQNQTNTGTRAVRVPDKGVILTSAGGTTIFFGATAGIRVSFGFQGATCAVTAPVMVSTL